MQIFGNRIIFFFLFFSFFRNKQHPMGLAINCYSVFLFLSTHVHSLNQTDNAAKIPNIVTKLTSNGNGMDNSMKLNNNNSSNGSINESNGKAVNIDEVSDSCFFFFFTFRFKEFVFLTELKSVTKGHHCF